MAMSLPIEFVNTIKYPIHVACECDYEIFVDGKFVDQANKEVNILENYYEGHPGWNATKFFFPVINTESPNIIAFHGTGGQFSGFINGFVMDMNNGADYTKYQEWKCKEFAVSVLPANWYSYDYDDSLWEMSKSFGMNYQNNSFQIFENERSGIHLQAEWLWTQDNSKTNVFCRKKDKLVQTIPQPPTTAVPTTAVPTTAVPTTAVPKVETTAASKIETTAVPKVETTAAPKIETTAVPKIETTAVPHVSVSIATHPTYPTHLKTTAVPKIETTAVPHVSVSIATHPTYPTHLKTTAAPKVETTAASKVETTAVPKVETRAVPKVETTAVPKVETRAVPKIETTAMPKVETRAVPKIETTAASKIETTAAPKVETTAAPYVSVSVATQPNPVLTNALISPSPSPSPAAPSSEIQNIYNIKIIINNAKISRNVIDKHVYNLLHHLHSSGDNDNDNDNDNNKLYRELYGIVKKTHEHLHRHYNDILDYYQKMLNNLYKQHHHNDGMERGDDIVDRYERRENRENRENREKGEKKEKSVDSKNILKNSSKLIESMIKLNHYIKVIEYKIQFIRGETKYNLLQILYSLRKQYQDDMIQMLKYL